MGKVFIGISLGFFLCSCATSYKQIQPSTLTYSGSSSEGGVTLGYRYDVLREKGNKKYAKRESLRGIRVIAVKIANNSSTALTIGQNCSLMSAVGPVSIVDPSVVHVQLKQGVPIYLLYLLMTPLQFNVTRSSGNSVETSSTPIGFVLGPALAIGNMAAAGGANQNFLRELEKYNLANKTINPGETVYGLIGIRDIGVNPLRLQIN
jgi:hypothetical protein